MGIQISELTVAEIIDFLAMQPHPEGGFYVETFRDTHQVDGNRDASTAIYFLLPKGVISRWHKVDAIEIWHWHAGAPLELGISTDGLATQTQILGPDLKNGHRPQGIVPRDAWQQARSMGDWTLVGCTVAPGFRFEGFVMAPENWEPGA